MIRKFIPYIGKYKKEAILCPVMIIGEVALEVLIPFLMARIVNVGIATGDLSYIVRMGLIMIGMAMLSLVFGAFAARLSSTAGAGFAKNLREAMFGRVQDFSFSNVDRFNTASLITRLTTDVSTTQQTFMMMLRIAVRSPVMLLCAVFMAVSVNASLAVVFIVAAPVIALTLAILMYFGHPRFLKVLKALDAMNGVVQENLIAIRVVKAFVREEHETEKFHAAAEHVRDMSFKAERLFIIVMPVMQLVMYACIVAIVWFGGNSIIAGGMLTGDLISFITYTSQILMSLMMLGMIAMMFIMARASLTRILEVLDEAPDIKSPENGATVVADGSIHFKDVSFRYQEGTGADTLRQINLSIESGKTVGIIGATGAAKTTLVQLIPRLYDVAQGAVYVGAKDVRAYELHALRDSVAMVLQKNVLFSGTIRENLKWGNDHATNEEIATACRVAQAHSFIMGFPDGYETKLGQGGVNISGGQKQRLCIARALLKRPKIMILDDSTSAVDTATDQKIREGLRESLSDMTTIIIAQRVASVMEADMIVVMDEGAIADVGVHEELLVRNDIYREIYTSQLKGVEEHA